MTPEEQQMLQRALQLSEENNKMLHAIRREAVWAKVWGAIKLLIILLPAIWAYYYLQPYMQRLNDLYQQTQAMQAASNKGTKSLQDWLNKLPDLSLPTTNSGVNSTK